MGKIWLRYFQENDFEPVMERHHASNIVMHWQQLVIAMLILIAQKYEMSLMLCISWVKFHREMPSKKSFPARVGLRYYFSYAIGTFFIFGVKKFLRFQSLHFFYFVLLIPLFPHMSKGVVHKWRHAIIDNFWHTLPHRQSFYYPGFSTIVTKSLKLPPSKEVTSFMDNP